MLTGKAAFDALASAAVPFIDQQFTYKGLAYTLTECVSVTGPYSDYCFVGNLYDNHQLVPPGVNALVLRYNCAASGNRPAIDAVRDLRVLTSIEIAEGLSSAALGDIAKNVLEAAR